MLNELKSMNIEEKTPYSNVITPPDFSEDQFQSVLLIDASWNDIEDVIHWVKTESNNNYNLYLYQDTMWEAEWLDRAVDIADRILINTVEGALTPFKSRLIADDRAWYYGPMKFAGSDRMIHKPIDFFKQLP